MTTTIADTLQAAAKKLGELSDTARLDAEVLLTMATGKNRTHFRAWPERHLTSEECSTFQSLLEKRLAGHPIAHLTGTREFWSREFLVTPDVLIPRPETELLVELALRLMDGCRSKTAFNCPDPDPIAVELGDFLGGQGGLNAGTLAVAGKQSPLTPLLQRGEPGKSFSELAISRFASSSPQEGRVAQIADLGTGSGAIAITLALELPRAAITALDLSPVALSVAAENAIRLGVGNIRFICSDWFAALPITERFDLIVSNPPYIAEHDPHLQQGDIRFEPSLALTSGADGLDAIRTITNEATNRLNPGGWLLFEHGYDQADRVVELLRTAGFEEIVNFPDLQGHIRVSGGRIGQCC